MKASADGYRLLVAEAGLKDFNIISFIGLYGPPNLPADTVKKANTALDTALKDATVIKGIADRGDEPGGGTPEQLGALTRSQYTTGATGQGQQHPGRLSRGRRER